MTVATPTETPDFGSLIAQRLCHDLVNPLGAISNGLELLAMAQSETPEMALMKDSLAQALGRIKLYRIAFGAATPTGTLAGPDLADALRAIGGSRPITLLTDLPAVLPRSDARLVALMALCAESALAWGGRLVVRAGEALVVTAEAARLRLDPALWEALGREGLPEAPTPPQVQFALLPDATRTAGRRIGVVRAEGKVSLTA
jgi:histidine phosphotransferase ChpT